MPSIRKNRLLVLTTTFPRWKDDATPSFIYELCRELQNDHEVIVLAPHHPQAKLEEDMEGLRVYRFPYFYPRRYQRLCYDGGILSNIKRSFLARIQAPLLILVEIYHAFKLCKKEKVNAINTHWIIPSGFVGAICKKVLGTGHIMTLPADSFALDRLPFKKKIAEFIVRNSDQITVFSSHIKEKLLSSLPPDIRVEAQGKMSIIPMGVHASSFQRKADVGYLKGKYGIPAKLTLLFMGRLVEKKGVSYLIKAMPEIVAQNRGVILIICGDGPLRRDLERLAEEAGVKGFVSFVGYVTGEKKLDYIAMSDIMIVPSIVTESGDTEGLPVVIQEGMAAGKPIIASDVGGIRDIIKNGWNGFLIEQKRSDQVAAKVLELIMNKDLRTELSEHAVETCREYDWAVIGGKYIKIIKSGAEDGFKMVTYE